MTTGRPDPSDRAPRQVRKPRTRHEASAAGLTLPEPAMVWLTGGFPQHLTALDRVGVPMERERRHWRR